MLNSIAKLLANISKRGNVITAVIVLTAVVIMIIPIPTTLADILITLNISVSVLILLVAFSLVSPTEFTTLPSLILIATLFRLSITITTSRLILLQADAGDIVAAFGHFVVGGNMAVGLIIFLIITTAQFLVITKGSERVAEVAARFTLDALPGKQMSIDSDLRNGKSPRPRRAACAEPRARKPALRCHGRRHEIRKRRRDGEPCGHHRQHRGRPCHRNCAARPQLCRCERQIPAAVGGRRSRRPIQALLVSVAAGTVITRVASEDQRNLSSNSAASFSARAAPWGSRPSGLQASQPSLDSRATPF